MSAPLALVTNDDGIDSYFLETLVEELERHLEVIVVAPEMEKSWSGTSVTRRSRVPARPVTRPNGKAWAVGGTPSDSVNIGMGNLSPRKPDLVLSGINIGQNTSLAMIASSGTVGAALEGAFWRIPSFALSMAIPGEIFEEVRQSQGRRPHSIGSSLRNAAKLAARFVCDHLGEDNPDCIVHNINFPLPVSLDTPVEETVPARFFRGSLFRPSEEGGFEFCYGEGRKDDRSEDTDWACLARGHISHSRLDYLGLSAL